MSGIEEYFADDLTYHVPPFPDMGKAELLEFIAGSGPASTTSS